MYHCDTVPVVMPNHYCSTAKQRHQLFVKSMAGFGSLLVLNRVSRRNLFLALKPTIVCCCLHPMNRPNYDNDDDQHPMVLPRSCYLNYLTRKMIWCCYINAKWNHKLSALAIRASGKCRKMEHMENILCGCN